MFYDDPPAIPETVQLYSQCLLSKWGFCDGDILEWLSDFGAFDRRAVLVELVKTKLLPTLNQPVEFEVINTIHNPIRVTTVDGQDVTHWHYETNLPELLTPEEVTVSGAEVLTLARQIQQRQDRRKMEAIVRRRWVAAYQRRSGLSIHAPRPPQWPYWHTISLTGAVMPVWPDQLIADAWRSRPAFLGQFA